MGSGSQKATSSNGSVAPLKISLKLKPVVLQKSKPNEETAAAPSPRITIVHKVSHPITQNVTPSVENRKRKYSQDEDIDIMDTEPSAPQKAPTPQAPTDNTLASTDSTLAPSRFDATAPLGRRITQAPRYTEPPNIPRSWMSRTNKNTTQSSSRSTFSSIYGRKPRKKYPLDEVLTKVLDQLKSKDVYGIFLQPVNPELVPDYYTIIKNPMDFGTMEQKIQTKKYQGMDDFKSDFFLVMNNAKIYNAPTTIYYKMAEKLLQAGTKLIEKEADSILGVGERNEEWDDHFMRGSHSRADSPQGKQDNIHEYLVKNINRKSKNVLRKQLEDVMAEKHLPDGTHIPEGEQHDIMKRIRFGSLYQQYLNISSVDHAYTSHVLDPRLMNATYMATGPFPNVDMIPPAFPQNPLAFYTTCDLYGDAYLSSLERFIQDMPPIVKKRVEDFTNEQTMGAKRLASDILDFLSRRKEAKEVNLIECCESPWGTLELNDLIKHAQEEPVNIIKLAELQAWRFDTVDISLLLSPVSLNPGTSMEYASMSTQELFIGNQHDVKELDLLKQARESSTEVGEDEKCVMERIRRRLLHLIQRAPPGDFTAKKLPNALQAIFQPK